MVVAFQTSNIGSYEVFTGSNASIALLEPL
jgi:hypothetical protein